MRIAIGCDHGAFALKNKVIEHLEKQGHEVRDFGTYSTESCDYPDFAAAAARAVASGECQRGIVLCTSPPIRSTASAAPCCPTHGRQK